MNKMNLEKKSENLFDKQAYMYNKFTKKDIVKHYLKKRTDFINNLIKEYNFVLDVGCGTGTTISKINSENRFGIDFSQGMLDEARRIDAKTNFKKMNAKKLLFKGNFFDFAYSANTLYYIQSFDDKGLEKALHEIKRVLKSNGKILIIEPNKRNLYWKIFLGKEKYDTGKEKHLSEFFIITKMRNIGLKNIKINYKGFMPAFCPRFLMPFAGIAEFLIENSVFAKYLCSHFYILGEK